MPALQQGLAASSPPWTSRASSPTWRPGCGTSRAARAGDPWAAGDLALAAALNGHLAEALAAADRVAAQVRGAYVRTLAALAALDTPRKATLEAVRARLEQAPG